MFLNEDVGGIIAAASAEGIVRLYRNYDPAYDSSGVQMVSSFRALTELIHMKRGSGVVMDWSPANGILLVGGDAKIIRAWNAEHEASTMDIHTLAQSPVTAIASDHQSNSTFVATFADGAMRVFDKRCKPEDAVVRVYRDHQTWVQNVRWRRGGDKELMTASVDGEVRLWDIRGSSPCVDEWNLFPAGLAAFDMHEQTDVFAASSAVTLVNWRQQTTAIHSLPPHHTELSRINLMTGLHHAPPRIPASSYIPSSSSLTFHPNEMLLAIGGADGTIRIMGCKLIEKHGSLPRRYELPPVQPSYEGMALPRLPSIRSISS